MGWLAVLTHLAGVADAGRAGLFGNRILAGSGSLVGSGFLAGPGFVTGSGVLAGTAVVLAAILLAMLACGPRGRNPVRLSGGTAAVGGTVRSGLRVAVPRHSDPDAPGRTRSRAPTAVLAAA